LYVWWQKDKVSICLSQVCKSNFDKQPNG
jgi:hypothetical protein